MERVATEFGAISEAVAFLYYFKDLPDSRQPGKVVYPLDEVLLFCLLAVLGGAETFVDIARFGEKKINLLRRFRPFHDGTPSHDHLGDIFATLNAEEFQRRFVAWVAALTGAPKDVIAIDGKTLRRSYQKKPEERRQSADPHGFGLRGAPAPRARPGQSGRQVERDRRHPGPPRYDGDRGRHRDDQCNGLPAQYRRENLG